MAGRKVVSVALEAKVQGFISGMRSAKASVDDLTKAAAPNKQTAFDDLSNKAALAGGAIAVGLGVAVKKFAEFDSAMSAVQANSCLLYTSPSPRDVEESRMPSSA